VWPVIRLLSGSLVGALRDVASCLVGVGCGEAAGGACGAGALLALVLIVGDILTVSIPAQVVYFSLTY